MGQLINQVYKKSIIIHDPLTYHEIREYINDDYGEMEPASNDGNDDSVMALMIAVITHISEDPLNYASIYSVGERPGGIEPPHDNWDAVAMDHGSHLRRVGLMPIFEYPCAARPLRLQTRGDRQAAPTVASRRCANGAGTMQVCAIPFQSGVRLRDPQPLPGPRAGQAGERGPKPASSAWMSTTN